MRKGKKPMKCKEVRDAHIYFPGELWEKISLDAEREKRSFTGQVCYIMEKHYKNDAP